jgi:cellulose synthase/poly-beta-1,6-N-acetylglucosamine synthase-like glycosyltransferase
MLFDLAFFMYGVVAFLGFFGYLYRCRSSARKAENVEFVIPSVADGRTINALREVVNVLKSRFSGYRVWIVVDEGYDVCIDGVETVVVPSSFDGKPCKGRALEFFRRNYVKPDTWYCFLDDDSYPLSDDFLYEIPFYEGRGYVGANGVLTPRMGRSHLCYILDHLRLWDDLFIFRLNTGLLGKPYIGFHGELLILHGKVLKEVGFSLNSITEDFNYAQKLVRRGYRTWQSRTKVSIRSPNNIRDLWRQRARWIKGILSDYRSYAPAAVPLIIFKLVGGITSSMIFSPLWLMVPTTTPLAFFGLFGTLYYLTSYIYGICRVKKWRLLLLSPILGIFEPISIFYIPKIKGFTVIDKN